VQIRWFGINIVNVAKILQTACQLAQAFGTTLISQIKTYY
jgi:hypothetical protein